MNTSVKNKKRLWVPAIPEPYYSSIIFGYIYKCMECKKYHLTKREYKKHYALDHLLDY